jgi:PST family polysaccharide transporter
MQALALYGVLYAVGWNAGDIFKAIGRPDILWKFALAHAAILIPALTAGALMWGITGVAAAHLVVAVPYSAARFWITHRVLHLPFSQIGRSITGSCVAGLALVTVTLAAGRLDANPWLVLACQAVLGGAVYVVLLVALDSYARRMLGTLRSRIGGRRSPAVVDEFPGVPV